MAKNRVTAVTWIVLMIYDHISDIIDANEKPQIKICIKLDQKEIGINKHNRALKKCAQQLHSALNAQNRTSNKQGCETITRFLKF